MKTGIADAALSLLSIFSLDNVPMARGEVRG